MDRAFDVLFALQRGTPLHGQWAVACLKGSWTNMVGGRLAAVCRPVALTDAVLEIEVVDKAWLDTVRGLQPDILTRLYDVTGGEVKRLKIIAGRIQSENVS